MLIILGGLPAVGKTTISRKLAERIGAVYLRIDTIENEIPDSLNIGETGYLIAYALAKDNLLIGHSVIADSVNPITITRDSWREVAQSTGKEFVEIEIICSDKDEHQKRVETRVTDIEGLVLPKWEDVLNREYHPWEVHGIRIDTAKHSPDQCVNEIINILAERLPI